LALMLRARVAGAKVNRQGVASGLWQRQGSRRSAGNAEAGDQGGEDHQKARRASPAPSLSGIAGARASLTNTLTFWAQCLPWALGRVGAPVTEAVNTLTSPQTLTGSGRTARYYQPRSAHS
jgi:hypothetical protein